MRSVYYWNDSNDAFLEEQMIKGYETKDVKASKTKANNHKEGVIFQDGERRNV